MSTRCSACGGNLHLADGEVKCFQCSRPLNPIIPLPFVKSFKLPRLSAKSSDSPAKSDIDNSSQSCTTPEQVISMVAMTHNISICDIKSRTRRPTITRARQEAYYLLRQHFNISLARVGMLLGGRSPSTVTYGYQVVARNIAMTRGTII